MGWVMLNSEHIVVKIRNDETIYAINDNTTLSIEIRGYKGEPIIGQWIADKKGYDNYISLKNGNETKRYEILISNRMKIFILDRLITYYRQQGVIINYVNKSFDDSKKSILLQLLLIFRHE